MKLKLGPGLVSVVYTVVALAALWVVAKFLLPLFLPFVLGMLIAMLINPLVDLAERRFRLPRGPVVALILLAVVGGLLVACAVGFSRLVGELGELYRQLPAYRAHVTEVSERLSELLGRVSAALPPSLQQALEDQWTRVYRGVEAFIGYLLNIARGLPNFFFVLIFSLLGSYFISRDRSLLGKFLLGLLPPRYRRQALTVQSEVIMSVLRFVRAQVLLVLLTMGLNIAGLMVLRVQYAVVIGLIAGILDILPVVGPSLIFLPWAVWAVYSGDVWLAVGLLVLYGGISVVRQAATVRLVGHGIGMHPLTALMSLYLGLRLFGPGGLVLGPLVAIFLKALVTAGVIALPKHDGDSGS